MSLHLIPLSGPVIMSCKCLYIMSVHWVLYFTVYIKHSEHRGLSLCLYKCSTAHVDLRSAPLVFA